MGGTLVCTHNVRTEALRPGSIVVSHGQARYLGEKLRTRCGYDEWTYTRYDETGAARTGETCLRVGSLVTVVAQLTDGALVTP